MKLTGFVIGMVIMWRAWVFDPIAGFFISAAIALAIILDIVDTARKRRDSKMAKLTQKV